MATLELKKKYDGQCTGQKNQMLLIWKYILRVVLQTSLDAGRKAKRMVMQCINGVGSNPVEGRTKIWQL